MRQQAASGLLEVVAADGFALLIDDAVQTTGRTPSRERIRELQRHRRARESNPTLFASSAIGDDLGVGQADDGVAGALFVSLRGKPETTMIWFRNERSFSVRWGGDPEHPHFANDDGRLSPRKSFALFLQNVFGHSRPWSAEELESAAELGSLIEIEALREREAFSKTVFNSMPEHISVLDAEGRIVSVNTAWKRFAECNDAPELATQAVGLSYRNICSGADGSSEAMEASAAWAGIESVLNRSRPSFTLDYPCDSPSEPHWFRMRVHPMLAPNEGVIVAHENITEQKLAAARLQQSEAKIKGILEGAADAIFIIDREGRIQFVNNEASRLVGYGREQLLRMNIRDLAPPAGVTNSLVEIDRLLATGSLRGEFALRRSAGATLPVEVNATLLPDGSIFSSWRDITERHFTQAALYENEERFRLAFIKSPIGMMLCHLDGYIFKVNAAACLMTGYSENETIGRRLSDLVLRDSAAAEEIELFRRIAAGDIKSFSVQQEHVHKDGHVYIAQNSLSVVCDNANTPLYGIAHLEDLTERQRRQLEALAKQTLKAQEEERFRLSRELHDDIGQSLTALKLALQRAQRKSGNEEVLSFMQEASDGTRHLLEAVRNIAYRLRPAHLTDLGLMSSLRWHIDKVVRPTGLSCTLGGNLKEIRLPAELEVCCFRVAQEALNNVIKHARATRIEVHLDRLADSITLSVRDDGIGFDVSKAYLTAENANSLGLIGMRERIAAMNGWLEVNSSPGHGTEIIATLPLAEGVS
jgi:PAS domain S-box-containing protein